MGLNISNGTGYNNDSHKHNIAQKPSTVSYNLNRVSHSWFLLQLFSELWYCRIGEFSIVIRRAQINVHFHSCCQRKSASVLSVLVSLQVCPHLGSVGGRSGRARRDRKAAPYI